MKANQIRFLIKSGDLRGIRVGARGVWCIGAAGLIQDVEDYIAEAHRRTAAPLSGLRPEKWGRTRTPRRHEKGSGESARTS
ncbi:hypothetical protein [Arthrobacter sp. SLBN-112]|uniref:hypothetical protein n=1 Tax=Arthrobacter sp. SLBN-112 TaxID=2768452 RepID=UPI0027B3964A|nr:hypothetical protein [Arthrobacter sp. SLBN-112]MDQ0798392.1 hypothetical protein [Arthrobacter sp. SLBN-112]